MEIEITREQDLSPRQDREIMELQRLSFPQSEDLARYRWCRTPLGDDLWFGVRREGRLVASVRLLGRVIRVGGKELSVGGVGNVCSHPDVRGSGAGKAVIEAVRDYFRKKERFDFGFLFCADEKRGFYARFDWREITNEMTSRESDGTLKRWKHDGQGHMMICPGRISDGQWPDGEVDLNGPTW